ncbi:MAG: hypothetical protein FWC41_02940 [Firmicutes bacterium]|nr:hypothetical protein [Bacillota bacterium]
MSKERTLKPTKKRTLKPVKELEINNNALDNNRELLNAINETKKQLLQKAETKTQEFNQLKVSFGTKSDLHKVTTYLYYYAQWDSKDIIHLEASYNSFNEVYENAKNDKDVLNVAYVDVDCLLKHLEKEKSNEDFRTRGLKGSMLHIFKLDEKGDIQLNEHKRPIIEDSFSIGYLKMLVMRANQETTVLRLEYQTLSEQIKMCDNHLQLVSIGQMPENSLEVALKQIQEKYDESIKTEKDGRATK